MKREAIHARRGLLPPIGRRKWLWVTALAIAVSGLASATEMPDAAEASPKEVDPHSYELRFLGVDTKKSRKIHQGLLLFIWKGGNPVKLLGFQSEPFEEKAFSPLASFSIHRKTGWTTGLGDWCGTGSNWVTFQPGEVITFRIPMWLDQDVPASSPLATADLAIISISSSEGNLRTHEFPLRIAPDK